MKIGLSDNYFSRRWRGQVPVSMLLFRDTLAVATLINLCASFIALVAIALDLHAGLALAIHFAPTPYNFFLVAAVGRAKDRNSFHELVAFVWLLVMFIV